MTILNQLVKCFGDLTVLQTLYSDGGHTAVHSHSNARLVLVFQGGFQERFGRKAIKCTAPSLIFRPPETLHSESFGHAGCLSLDLGPSWMKRLPNYFQVLEYPFLFQSNGLVPIFSKIRQEIRTQDSYSELAIEAILIDLLMEASPHRSNSGRKHPGWLFQVTELLKSDSLPQTSLAAVASAVGVHPVHLSRVFRKTYGCTVAGFLRYSRIQKVQHDLIRSNKPLCDIAMESGFADQSHFTRVFKSATGFDPCPLSIPEPVPLTFLQNVSNIQYSISAFDLSLQS